MNCRWRSTACKQIQCHQSERAALLSRMMWRVTLSHYLLRNLHFKQHQLDILMYCTHTLNVYLTMLSKFWESNFAIWKSLLELAVHLPQFFFKHADVCRPILLIWNPVLHNCRFVECTVFTVSGGPDKEEKECLAPPPASLTVVPNTRLLLYFLHFDNTSTCSLCYLLLDHLRSIIHCDN